MQSAVILSHLPKNSRRQSRPLEKLDRDFARDDPEALRVSLFEELAKHPLLLRREI